MENIPEELIAFIIMAPVVIILLINTAIGSLRQKRKGGGKSYIKKEKFKYVVNEFFSKAKDQSFMVFIFSSSHEPSEFLNMQYSIEHGKPGLDWVLEGDENTKEKENVMKFFTEQKSRVEDKELNDVVYLRVENGDIVNLGYNLIYDHYGVSDEDEIEVLTEYTA